MNMPNIDMNQQKEITVLSADEFDKQYGITGRGRTSEFDIPMFYDAVEIAKKNPNMFVKWYLFQVAASSKSNKKDMLVLALHQSTSNKNGMDNLLQHRESKAIV